MRRSTGGVKLIAEGVVDVTQPSGVVPDPFVGSGATLVAANRPNRLSVGLELEPEFDSHFQRRPAASGEAP